jgi:hypothetical protein
MSVTDGPFAETKEFALSSGGLVSDLNSRLDRVPEPIPP